MTAFPSFHSRCLVRFRRALPAIACAALSAACSSGPRTAPHPATGAAAATPRTATAALATPDGTRRGQAMFTAVPTGVEIAIHVSGVAPGRHGFHIHAGERCAPGPDPATGQTVAFGAAQGHFDPGRSSNHGRPGDPAHMSHAGELPNLDVGTDGNGSQRYVNTQVTLAPGATSVVGRTLVVHADADDYQTDPAGNSGARILCGIIEPVQGVGAVVGRADAPAR